MTELGTFIVELSKNKMLTNAFVQTDEQKARHRLLGLSDKYDIVDRSNIGNIIETAGEKVKYCITDTILDTITVSEEILEHIDSIDVIIVGRILWTDIEVYNSRCTCTEKEEISSNKVDRVYRRIASAEIDVCGSIQIYNMLRILRKCKLHYVGIVAKYISNAVTGFNMHSNTIISYRDIGIRTFKINVTKKSSLDTYGNIYDSVDFIKLFKESNGFLIARNIDKFSSVTVCTGLEVTLEKFECILSSSMLRCNDVEFYVSEIELQIGKWVI